VEVGANKVVQLDYELKDDEGNIIDRSDDGSFAYLHGAGNIIPGLEEALAGKPEGAEATVSLKPEEAYGERDPSRVAQISRDLFPSDADLAPGQQFQAQSPEGEDLVLTVVETQGDTVTVDANHFLAGKSLHFDVKVLAVRDATEEELSHGHAHGPGGHHH